jgi:ribonuclease PH
MERERGVSNPFGTLVSAISVGIVDNEVRLDLAYKEDSAAQVDANVVMAEPDLFVEVQGTAEGRPFTRTELDAALDLAAAGAKQLFAEQRRVLGW